MFWTGGLLELCFLSDKCDGDGGQNMGSRQPERRNRTHVPVWGALGAKADHLVFTRNRLLSFTLEQPELYTDSIRLGSRS